MMADLAWLETALKYGATAVGGGLIGSWVSWSIEKRRLKRQYRADLVGNWRKLIADLPQIGGWSRSDPKCSAIVANVHFQSLESHLSADLLKQLRSDRMVVVGSDFPRRALSERVAELEKKWGLI